MKLQDDLVLEMAYVALPIFYTCMWMCVYVCMCVHVLYTAQWKIDPTYKQTDIFVECEAVADYTIH